jgi:hypothetical protein
MEFTKDITFGGDLKANKTAKITYSGDLYKKGSDFVAIVYGFGQNWDYTTEQPMDKMLCTKDQIDPSALPSQIPMQSQVPVR